MGVFFWKNNQCFLRSECTLDECEAGVAGQESYQFDTFTDDSAHSSLGIKSSNEVSDVFGYEQHQHLNCYSGHGGTDLGPDNGLQKDVDSAGGCGLACENNDECSCFVFFWKNNQCFLRSECTLDECEAGVAGQESYQFDTFTEDSAHSSLGIKSSNEVSIVLYYEQHQHLNCYRGHGGTDLGPDNGLQKDVDDAAACGLACQ